MSSTPAELASCRHRDAMASSCWLKKEGNRCRIQISKGLASTNDPNKAGFVEYARTALVESGSPQEGQKRP